ncbi:MAG: hypothetical protein KDK48_05315 [Chlamydiia bacterium]|nr:hypothetical protein [Chlamydiia bacterium]
MKKVDALFHSATKLKPFISNPKFGSEIRDNIAKLERACKNSNAAFCTIDDPDAVLKRYKTLSEKDPSAAKLYIQGKDEQGKTFFHHLLGSKGSLQFQTVQALENALGKELFDECFTTLKDHSGKTALDLSIGRGDMALVVRYFPIQKSTEGRQVPDSVFENVGGLLQTLASPNARSNHLRSCPGETEYDALNHIRSALHHIACADLPRFQALVEAVPNKEELPFSFGEYTPQLLKEGYENPCRRVDQAESVTQVVTLQNELGLIAPDRWDVFSQINGRREGRTLLFETLPAVVRVKDPAKRDEAVLALKSEVLNPYAPYDQKVDFASSEQTVKEGVPILQRLLLDAAMDEAVDMEATLAIMELLIVKYPALLRDKDSEEKTLFQVAEGLEKNFKNLTLKKRLRQIEQKLPETMFRQATLRSLKYVLEEKGLNYSRREGLSL